MANYINGNIWTTNKGATAENTYNEAKELQENVKYGLPGDGVGNIWECLADASKDTVYFYEGWEPEGQWTSTSNTNYVIYYQPENDQYSGSGWRAGGTNSTSDILDSIGNTNMFYYYQSYDDWNAGWKAFAKPSLGTGTVNVYYQEYGTDDLQCKTMDDDHIYFVHDMGASIDSAAPGEEFTLRNGKTYKLVEVTE